MDLRLYIRKVILKCLLWKYINDGNWDYFTLLLSGNSSTTFMWLINSTDIAEPNLVLIWIMVIMILELRTLWFLVGNIAVLVFKTV